MKKIKSILTNKQLSIKQIILFGAAGMIALTVMITVILNHPEQVVSETRFMLDTVCTISVFDREGDKEKVIDDAFRICSKYERMLSTTISGSDIYRLNHSEGKPVSVSADTAGLIGRALVYCRVSGGKFDITIYPVKQLWNFSGDSDQIPDAKKLSMAAELVDYSKISMDGSTVTIPKGMGIDLGAIAKGFVADKIAEYFRNHNVKSAIIDLGGNVYAYGSKPDGSPWRVGIKMPFSDGEADVAEVSDKSVVTSGVYQRYFEKNGRLYHHILRSSDGMPCDTGLYSVTVISPSSEQCDALSTVCMLLGYDDAVGILKQYEGVEAVFIQSDSSILYYK